MTRVPQINSLSKRIKWTMVLGLIGAVCLWGKLYHLQVIRQAERLDANDRLVTKRFPWIPRRGLILDRNQRILVTNCEKTGLYAYPPLIKQATRVASILEPILEMPATTLLERLTSHKDEVLLQKNLSPEVQETLLNLSIEGATQEAKANQKFARNKRLQVAGLVLVPEVDRNYIKSHLLGQVIGYMGFDKEKPELGYHGVHGIEAIEEEHLKGNPVTLETRAIDTTGSILEFDYTREVPIRGADVVLTIDETIQWITEKVLFETCRETSCKSGSVVVVDPCNGEILALANYPPFDPSQKGFYQDANKMDYSRNNAITSPFEPGSTIKPIIAAIGLEKGAITIETKIDCQHGSRTIDRKYRKTPIRDEHPMGIVSVTDVLVSSSNVGIGKIGEKIADVTSGYSHKEDLYNSLLAFGMGGRINTDLPGESSMFLKKADSWNQNDLLVLCFGAGPIMVHTIGLAKAYSVLANGGLAVTPHVVKGYLGSRNRYFYPKANPEPVRILQEENADRICAMLAQVVIRGTGKKARSNFYSTAGKTGTAKKVVDKVYSMNHRVLSFAGFAPVERPKIVVIVQLDEPQGYRFGGTLAAPVFKKIVEEVLAYLHVPPDVVDPTKPIPKEEELEIEETEEVAFQNISDSTLTGVVEFIPGMAREQMDSSGEIESVSVNPKSTMEMLPDSGRVGGIKRNAL
jgi:cell division protein FtsI (penicillin-binding protein 3)